MTQQVTELVTLPENPVRFQYPHDSSQLSIMPVPAGLVSSSGTKNAQGVNVVHKHTYMQSKYPCT